MSNRRRHPRTPMTVTIKITHESIGEKIVKTRNISESGIFIVVEPTNMPPIGSLVRGQVQGMIDNPPILDMQIVRAENDGLGLQFLEAGDQPVSD